MSKTFKKPVIIVKDTTEKRVSNKSAMCSGASSHIIMNVEKK